MSTPVTDELFTLLNMGTFNERLKELVAEKRATEKEVRAALAKLGLTRSNLSHWFSGRAIEPKVATVAPAADYFGVDAVWFATGVGVKRPTEGNNKMPAKLVGLSQEAVDFAIMYDGLEPHVQELIRRHARDVNEALGSPSPKNPYGKGKRPAAKGAAKKRRKPGTQ